MFIKQPKAIINSKIFKLLIFAQLILAIPIFSNNNIVKAGLEFQWDQDSGYRKLKWFQKDDKRRARNKIFFFLRPSDRKKGLLLINMKIPKTFKTTLTEEKISLCQVKIGGFEGRTKCIENIPADVEINEDNKSLDIYPYKPLPSNKDSYAIVFKVFNPKRTGLYQFHSYGQYSMQSQAPVLSYLGSWTIVID